jgi:tetratricopeptide (TPR) repeat protein
MSGLDAPSHPHARPSADPVEVRETLARVTASDAFRGAPQLASFLTYIVGMTLEGRGAEIKGYTIATRALGRDESFDPQSDPIVRVEAMRLRRALEAYHAETGGRDRVRIVIPRGSYVPVFETLQPPDEAAEAEAPAPHRPAPPSSPVAPPPAPHVSAPPPARGHAWGVAVALGAAALGIVGSVALRPGHPAEPRPAPVARNAGLQPLIAVAAADPAAARLREEVIDALAPFDDVAVAERTEGLVEGPGVYRLTFRPAGGSGAIQARLVGPGGRVTWTQELRPSDPGAAGAVATMLARSGGVVLADLAARDGGGDPGLRCLVAAHRDARRPAEEAAASRACLDARAAGGRDALASALLARALLRVEDAAAAAPRALTLARAALALRPESPAGHRALMAALFAGGETEAALAAGRRALALNPLDPDLRADLADHLVAAGRFEECAREMARALAGDPAAPARHRFTHFLSALMSGDDAAAAAAAGRIDPAEFPPGHLARALAAKRAGRVDAARREIAALQAADPRWDSGLARHLRHPAIAARVRAELGALLPGGAPPG